MNSNQRSQENNQTDNMANEKSVSSARGGTTENYSKQSQGNMGSQQTERGAGTGGSGQSQADLRPQQSRVGEQGSQQSQDKQDAAQQPLADGLSQQPQQRPDLQSGRKNQGGSTLYGTGQGQHAQSSGGHEGADTRDQPMKEGAGMPAQGDVGRSAQTGGSQPQGGGKMGQASEGQGEEDRSRQSSLRQGGAQRDSAAGSSQLSGSTDSANTDSTGRAGSQTGNQQLGNELFDDVGNQRYSNDSAGGMPRSPAGSHMAAEEKMNDDTGLSNSANRQEIDMGTKQEQQSNVGRRSDMTPD